jgi:hypothetical protein
MDAVFMASRRVGESFREYILDIYRIIILLIPGIVMYRVACKGTPTLRYCPAPLCFPPRGVGFFVYRATWACGRRRARTLLCAATEHEEKS